LLPRDLPRAEWLTVLRQAHHHLVQRVDADEATALDAYGAQGEDEFFAVASEAFFVTPQAMKDEHPALYGVFERFYRQDPVKDRP
jgi:MtfA peptidase